ncbi:ADR124Cp [Eremothecium gossypii ATCC 10895]|uniref:ADR124Cp n=1 Tax=Eremothecium gossypii (strain ATCC 10895 / CBS 109.51 / FGSC 9923 / NRRL Y-1056) TaxID=284811 RepID=Q759Z9_EREGS|nr:ADR124Cp [Eremothecium gossypii ATCC 10895]AAS52044.2 ADR124Cp [Eremothecium gossypii ATCC 10895]AEY96344.1 FADR124Cp [Eremothecium gossypii FDAG1]
MRKSVLFFLLPFYVHCEKVECDLQEASALMQSLAIDKSSLSSYHSIIPMVEQCKGPSWDRMKNEVYYKSGLIHLSVGQELKAMESFEKVIASGEPSFKMLSEERLHELYKKMALWSHIEDDDNDKLAYYALLDNITQADGDEVYQALESISPLDYQLRVNHTDVLLEELADSLDLNTAQRVVENYMLLADKYATSISLTDRLELQYRVSVVQWFVLNSPPVASLKKCLSLDMDYKPCTDLMKLWNKWNKNVKVSASALTDAQEYFGIQNQNWDNIINLMVKDQKPLIKLEAPFTNNYALFQKVAEKHVLELLNNRPLSNSPAQRKYTKLPDPTEFQTSLDVLLCLAFDMKSSSKNANKFCDRALKQVLTPKEHSLISNYLTKVNSPDGIPELLKTAYETYPHLAFHLVKRVAAKLVGLERKGANADVSQHWNILSSFIGNHKKVAETGRNKFTAQLFKHINRAIGRQRQKQEQDQQQFFERQYQQQFFRQQQQQQQQQQPHQPPSTKKNYYKILGIGNDANAKDIRRAYLHLTKKYHPDKQGNMSDAERAKVEEKMSSINEAYEVLSDESKRKEYDMLRSGGGSQHAGGNGQQFYRNSGPMFNFKKGFKPF